MNLIGDRLQRLRQMLGRRVADDVRLAVDRLRPPVRRWSSRPTGHQHRGQQQRGQERVGVARFGRVEKLLLHRVRGDERRLRPGMPRLSVQPIDLPSASSLRPRHGRRPPARSRPLSAARSPVLPLSPAQPAAAELRASTSATLGSALSRQPGLGRDLARTHPACQHSPHPAGSNMLRRAPCAQRRHLGPGASRHPGTVPALARRGRRIPPGVVAFRFRPNSRLGAGWAISVFAPRAAHLPLIAAGAPPLIGSPADAELRPAAPQSRRPACRPPLTCHRPQPSPPRRSTGPARTPAALCAA